MTNRSLQHYVLNHKTQRTNLGSYFCLPHAPLHWISKGGIPVAPLTYHVRKAMGKGGVLSPWQIMQEITHEELSFHINAVYCLADAEVSDFLGSMSTLTYSFWRYIEYNWKVICSDISAGTITHPEMSGKLKIDLENGLQPKPERANELRDEFEKGMDGICQRIWPNCACATMFTTGGFANYAKLLSGSFMKGVKLLSLSHGASEGTMGICLGLDCTDHSYCFTSTVYFFEFIHEENLSDENPCTCFLDEVEVGQNYEIVVTSIAGLYRYRLGDIVRIVGRKEGCPTYEFLYRSGQMLNLMWEKTPESVFYSALTKTVEECGISIRDYTACEDSILRNLGYGDVKDKGHYVLFLEIEDFKNSDFMGFIGQHEVTVGNTFDRNLCDTFEPYLILRAVASIEEVRVIFVSENTFYRVKYHLIENTQNPQFKMPRVMRDPTILKLLLSNMMKQAE